MRCLILSLVFGLPPQAPGPLPPQAPPPRPPAVMPQRLPAGPATRLVPCGTCVTVVSRTFRDGSHEHVCPVCGTRWVHGGRSGNPVSHVCPGFRTVAVPQTQARQQQTSWVLPSSIGWPATCAT